MGALALRLTGGAKRYHRLGREQTVFEHVDLELERGEIFALLGPSGCGKSTLLRTLAGLEPLTEGRVELGQAAAPAGAQSGTNLVEGGAETAVRAVGIVFQDPLLLPWLSVAENVRLGLRYRAARGAAVNPEESVAQILHDFGLADVARSYPEQLSGGQAQRASFARTIVTRPALLLLDEPFAALDPRTRGALQDWLLDVARRRHLTVLLVTHDVEEALYLGDRVGLMGARSGAGSTITRIWDAGHPTGPTRRRDDERLLAIRREILTHYQTDVPSGIAPRWVV